MHYHFHDLKICFFSSSFFFFFAQHESWNAILCIKILQNYPSNATMARGFFFFNLSTFFALFHLYFLLHLSSVSNLIPIDNQYRQFNDSSITCEVPIRDVHLMQCLTFNEYIHLNTFFPFHSVGYFDTTCLSFFVFIKLIK